MDWSWFQNWLSTTPVLLIAVSVFLAMCLGVAVGVAFRSASARRAKARDDDKSDGQEGYIVSAVLGLLALLMGFTFSLAVDRFETRRSLVLEEANAIGTAYLRTQLLPEPHRTRLSNMFVAYTDNRIALAKASGPSVAPLVRKNDALLFEIWAATSAGFDAVRGIDFSSAFLDSVNSLIDLDASRKTARAARVPPEVFAVLLIYIVTTACVMGYVLHGKHGRIAAGFLLALLTLSLTLIIDIDRPSAGGVVEGQAPMEELRATLAAQPPHSFDRYRSPPAPDAGGARPPT